MRVSRAIRPLGSALGLLDEGDGFADGLQVLDLVVGDRDAELLLGGHDDLDHGERVDVEVIHERLVELDVLGGDAGDLVTISARSVRISSVVAMPVFSFGGWCTVMDGAASLWCVRT